MRESFPDRSCLWMLMGESFCKCSVSLSLGSTLVDGTGHTADYPQCQPRQNLKTEVVLIWVFCLGWFGVFFIQPISIAVIGCSLVRWCYVSELS